MIIVVIGVSGVGKTTIGRALAENLHWQFADADDYHSAANVAKMRAGIPLTDQDRAPWLQSLHGMVAQWLEAKQNVVLAFSGLKASYRDIVLIDTEVRLVYLRGSPELVAARMAGRHGHYMNPSLLASQFATLEEPDNALTIDAGLTTGQIVDKIRTAFGM
jgi:gluconokinase